jgi:bifunctional non-homologous end joining protein LigD
MAGALDVLDEDERALLRPGPPPRGTDAMKATLTDERFSDPNWIYERKLDGIRCIAVREGQEVRLRSRNDLPLEGRWPTVAAAVGAQPGGDFAVDGEVVAFDGSTTSFARLADARRGAIEVFLYVFDVLWVDGCDVRPLPLRARKRLLRALIATGGPLRMTTHRNGDGEAYFREACARGWEGLIAKRADSPYATSRSRDWLKFKCEQGQELVIGGFTEPKGSRTEFGALLVGVYDGDALRYAGKVGTGFGTATLRELGARLRELRRDDPPFADPSAIKERGVTWVQPELVAQVGFTEWTRDGRLRHPRFQGLREDKAARDVVREA